MDEEKEYEYVEELIEEGHMNFKILHDFLLKNDLNYKRVKEYEDKIYILRVPELDTYTIGIKTYQNDRLICFSVYGTDDVQKFKSFLINNRLKIK